MHGGALDARAGSLWQKTAGEAIPVSTVLDMEVAQSGVM